MGQSEYNTLLLKDWCSLFCCRRRKTRASELSFPTVQNLVTTDNAMICILRQPPSDEPELLPLDVKYVINQCQVVTVQDDSSV